MPKDQLDVQIETCDMHLARARTKVRGLEMDWDILMDAKAERDYGIKRGMVVMDTVRKKHLKITRIKFESAVSRHPLVSGVHKLKDGTWSNYVREIFTSWELEEENKNAKKD
jgi:hypothetical protein